VESVIEVLGTRLHRVPNRYRVALVIEGGGSRGMFSAGMASASKNSGSSRFFEVVYRRAAGYRAS
jgi:predicted patatin/cPLA2 family phospholipase